MEIVTPEEAGLSAERLARIDAYLTREFLEPGRLAGTQTLVARHGRVAHFSTLGSPEIEGSTPLRDDSIFRIYSMTKPITSVAAMMLHERGCFQLRDRLADYLPEFGDLRVYQQGLWPNYVTRPCTRPLEIRDVLMHAAGFTYGFVRRTNVDHGYRKAGIGEPHGALDLAGFARELGRLPLEFSPGEAWCYGVSTDVLGYLVQVVSGRPFEEFLREEIFTPLGMVDTDFFVPADKAGRFLPCYERGLDGETRLGDDPADSPYLRMPNCPSGGGGLVSTTSDYFRFCEMLRRGGELDGVRLLSRKTIELMTVNHLPGDADLTDRAIAGSFSETPYEGVGFGLGFSVNLGPARTARAGSFGEFAWGGMASTAFWIDPLEDLVVIFMTQLIPSSAYDIRTKLRTLVYAALTD